MDPVDQKRTHKGTAFACIVCKRVVLGFKKQALEEYQSLQELREDIEWFRVTTCQPCRRDIISIPKAPETGVILLPGRERPVAQQTIATWVCYKELCEYLGRRPEIYQLENWNVIENLYRIEDEMEDDYVVLKYEGQKDGTHTKDEPVIEFFVSNKPPIPEDAMLENTRVDRLDDACLGCVQCPAILPLIRGQEPTDVWFRPTTCRRCREITTGRSLCPVGDVPVGADLLKALPSFSAAMEALGKNMRLAKTQGFCVIESSYMLIGQYLGGDIDDGDFF